MALQERVEPGLPGVERELEVEPVLKESLPEPPPAAAPPREPETASQKPGERLLSLDAFRGLTILGMLLVNNVALDTATPAQLQHAPWNGGVRLADLVFPWFLFIVGVALPYSAGARKARGIPGWQYLARVIGRTASLVFFGCLIDSSLAKQPVFGLDVLQLIGLAYCVAAILYELPAPARLGVAALFLSGHWAAIRFYPVPGVGAGVFTEEQNLIGYLNQVYLDPYGLKGLVSVIPTSALVLIGTAAGDLLRRSAPGPALKTLALLAGGGILAAGGWLWSWDLPFNKPVWTASYILFTAGLGMSVLALFYGVVDGLRWRLLASPLIVFGANAIVAYVAPVLVKVHVLREWSWPTADGPLPLDQALLRAAVREWGRVPGGWAYTAGYIAVWWLVLLYLYRKKLFVRV